MGMKLQRHLMALLIGLYTHIAWGADPIVSFDSTTPGKLAILVDGTQVALCSYYDEKVPRPYLAHVKAPCGVQVTRNFPPVEGKDLMDHPDFHPGIWLSFGDISGNDYWRLKSAVRYIDSPANPIGGPGEGSFTGRFAYLDQADPAKSICTETIRIKILVRPEGYLYLWDSTFKSDQEFYFGDQEEMGLGFRMATPLRVEQQSKVPLPPGNGTIIDAAGRKNSAEVWGKASAWCDYSGTLDGQHVGITVMCHPENFRPSWYHARDYGFLTANPFGRAAFKQGKPSKVVVKPGETLRLRYGIFVHCSAADKQPDLDAAYQDYREVADK